MADIQIAGAPIGNALQQLLTAPDIEPGDEPSYQTCKAIYLYHPLGAKMADAPISMAQSQKREISIPGSPEDMVKDQFEREWKAIGADMVIFNTKRQSRIYGVSSLAMLIEGEEPEKPVNYPDLHRHAITFNVMDPLNTAGSLVLTQNPNAWDFQSKDDITVSGSKYHSSRVVIVMNEDPIYLGYTVSAFGYVGRSVYQRALYPLRSFINTMITDDMVALKSAVLIAKLKQPGSIIDRAMAAIAGVKRNLVKESRAGNVISISIDEEIESLNLQNIDGAYGMARTNILKNTATASHMPARLLENETMVSGFGEGTEDAKNIAGYIDEIRREMAPLYDFMDNVVMHRAWTPAFYETVRETFPEYRDTPFTAAFYRWKNAFHAEWPSLLREPESELAKVDDVKLKAAIAIVEVMNPILDPENKARLAQFLADNVNASKRLFPQPLELDYDALRSYTPPVPEQGEGGNREPNEPAPFKEAA